MRTLDEISKEMERLVCEAYKAGEESAHEIALVKAKRAVRNWVREHRKDLMEMLSKEEGIGEVNNND